MTSHTPAAAEPSAAETLVEITETRAFARAWVLFGVLFVAVIGILWALQARFG